MMSYASIIFAQSGSSLSPTISAIIVGVIQFIGSYVSTMLVDRLGRRVNESSQYKMVLAFTRLTIENFISLDVDFNGFFICWYRNLSRHFGNIHLLEHDIKSRSYGRPMDSRCQFFNDAFRSVVWRIANSICHSQ